MKMSFRGLSFLMAGAAFVLFAFLSPNCQPSGGDFESAGGSSGNEKGGSGGNSEKGGSGGKGTGGSDENGGSGGNEDTGGKGSGGKGSGGKAAGGSGGKGGSAGEKEGGASGSGGVTGKGGSSETGTGGSTTPVTTGPTGTTVTFVKGKASGAMLGYGWVSLGSDDSVSDPKCGTEEITSTSKCSATTWSTEDSLCISGEIPALPETPTDADYAANWGMSVGVNATEPAGSGIGQAFKTVAITVTGSPKSGLRALIHKKGDSDGTSYCIALTSGTALTLTKFATDCYADTPAKTFAAADIPNIDKVAVQVYSGSTAITVKDLCITKIEFTK